MLPWSEKNLELEKIEENWYFGSTFSNYWSSWPMVAHILDLFQQIHTKFLVSYSVSHTGSYDFPRHEFYHPNPPLSYFTRSNHTVHRKIMTPKIIHLGHTSIPIFHLQYSLIAWLGFRMWTCTIIPQTDGQWLVHTNAITDHSPFILNTLRLFKELTR